MSKHSYLATSVGLLALFVCSSHVAAAENFPLSALDLSKMTRGLSEPKIDRAATREPIVIGGQTFARGVGTHGRNAFYIDLGGGSSRFRAKVGMDDSQKGKSRARVEFRIVGDAKTLFRSGPMAAGDLPKTVDLDLHGVRTLVLLVDSASRGINFADADWADAAFLVTEVKPVAIEAPREEAVILTPKAPPQPRINAPAVYGCRPDNPFLYRIPATGERPMKFAVDNLPETLKLDADTGIITGTNPSRGESLVTLHAENSRGKAEKKFKIVSGDTLCLTPPMGWNSWNACYHRTADRKIREAADGMISNGMADVGYQYVSIDDCWGHWKEKAKAPRDDTSRRGELRDEAGNILPNQHFPNMKALTEYIHSYGLKAGIYSSPGPTTCSGYCGSYQHEEQDARQFADWGFDMLKYDWCSYSTVVKGSKSLEKLKRPYILMGRLLQERKRDIHLNLCQYGMGDVWEWGAEVGGQSWRMSGDLGYELERIIDIATKNTEHRKWSKPGSWNDPDYLLIGYTGSAFTNGEPVPCPLTPNEQYSFMSLWCLTAAPLFYSGDVSRLSAFELGILCNTEVIEVDQDPLGQCARTVALDENGVLFVKDMADGSKAVGLCNRGEMEVEITGRWSDLSLSGRQRVRDLWRQKDLGEFTYSFTTKVGRHGTFLIRLWPASK